MMAVLYNETKSGRSDFWIIYLILIQALLLNVKWSLLPNAYHQCTQFSLGCLQLGRRAPKLMAKNEVPPQDFQSLLNIIYELLSYAPTPYPRGQILETARNSVTTKDHHTNHPLFICYRI